MPACGPILSPWSTANCRLRGVSSEIAVNPFSLDEVKDYLARRFPDMEIPDSVSHALFTRTGGLPLFVSNLIEYLVSQHKGWPLSTEIVVDKALPDTIRRVIEREIERLSLDEQRLLDVASAIGSNFSAILLGAVLDMDVAEVDRGCDALGQTRPDIASGWHGARAAKAMSSVIMLSAMLYMSKCCTNGFPPASSSDYIYALANALNGCTASRI